MMGIINVTPDSFYSASRKLEISTILSKAKQMIEEGASFIDIGGYSSRPGAEDISIEEECSRVLDPIKAIKDAFPEIPISIDSFRAEVAARAIGEGASLVNDISAGYLDSEMLPLVAKEKLPYIAMHMRGNPQNMQSLADYEDVVGEIISYFSRVLEKTNHLGINDVILDPGIGFAKRAEQSFEILDKLDLFRMLGRPLLIGVSRKSLIYKTLQIKPEDSLNGTTALNTLALLKGVKILRVHDVREAVQTIDLIGNIKSKG